MLTLNTDPIHGSLSRKASLSFQERCDYVVRYRRRKKTTAFSSLNASGGFFHVGGAQTYIRVNLRNGLLYAAKQSHAPLLRTPQWECAGQRPVMKWLPGWPLRLFIQIRPTLNCAFICSKWDQTIIKRYFQNKLFLEYKTFYIFQTI